MRSYTLALAPLIGLYSLAAQIVPAPPIKPLEPAPPSIQRNPFEAVSEPPRSPSPKVSGPIIETIEFRGARRVPQQILRLLISTRVGDGYDTESLHRESQALYKTGRFSEIGWETERGAAGAIVRFTVVERPLVQSIEYHGDDAVTLPEILGRFTQRKVKLRVETLLNKDDLKLAAMTVQELLVEKGRRNITVTPLVEPIGSPATVKITFRVEEKQ
jgi:outer membrane protein insertion porin family